MKHVLAFFMLLSFMLASADIHAGPGRPSFSSRPSYGGFRSSSSPSYRSFSPSPSRTFTYRSTPRYSAPAAPRYSAPSTSRNTYRSSKSKTVVNNHYHGSNAGSGGGLGLMDYVILDNMMSRDRSPGYVSAPAVVQQPVVQAGYAPNEGTVTQVVYQEETHYWRNFFIFLLGLGCLYGLYRLIRAVELVD